MKKNIIFCCAILVLTSLSAQSNLNSISKEDVEILVDKSCKKLLVNPNTQTYTYEIKE